MQKIYQELRKNCDKRLKTDQKYEKKIIENHKKSFEIREKYRKLIQNYEKMQRKMDENK